MFWHFMAVFWIKFIDIVVTFGYEISKVWLNKWSWTFWFVLDLCILTIHVKSVFQSNSFVRLIDQRPIKCINVSDFFPHFCSPLCLKTFVLLVILIEETALEKVLFDIRLILYHSFVLCNNGVWSRHENRLTFVLFNYRIFRLTITLNFYNSTRIELFLNIMIEYRTTTLLFILIIILKVHALSLRRSRCTLGVYSWRHFRWDFSVCIFSKSVAFFV